MTGSAITVYNPYSLERFQRCVPLLDQGGDYHDDVRAQPVRRWQHAHIGRIEDRSTGFI